MRVTKAQYDQLEAENRDLVEQVQKIAQENEELGELVNQLGEEVIGKPPIEIAVAMESLGIIYSSYQRETHIEDEGSRGKFSCKRDTRVRPITDSEANVRDVCCGVLIKYLSKFL